MRVLVSKRITNAEFSSLVSSQTSGRGTAEAGDAKVSRSSSALIPLQYSKVIECIVFRALLHRNECLGIFFIVLVMWQLFRSFALLWTNR